MVVASGATQLTTQIEHASPQTTARLEEEGVADPDRVLSDLVEEYTGEAESSPAAGVISAGDTGSRAPAAQRRAMTPGVPASGDRSIVAAMPWYVVTGVTLVALIGAVVEGGKMWVAPGIVVPLGAVWIALDRYLQCGRATPLARARPPRIGRGLRRGRRRRVHVVDAPNRPMTGKGPHRGAGACATGVTHAPRAVRNPSREQRSRGFGRRPTSGERGRRLLATEGGPSRCRRSHPARSAGTAQAVAGEGASLRLPRLLTVKRSIAERRHGVGAGRDGVRLRRVYC
jgi:hypothetical protein